MSATTGRLPRRNFLARALAAVAGGAWFFRPRASQADVQQDMPYVGEIRMFAGTFAPQGWAFCEGQLLPIAENETLFSLIGTTYGGDGQETFALPDLRGRAPVHFSQSWLPGETRGAEDVLVLSQQIPAHSHVAGAASGAGDSVDPAGRVPARNAGGTPQYSVTIDGALAADAIVSAGGSVPHNNMQPYLCIHFIISLFGAYPSQT